MKSLHGKFNPKWWQSTPTALNLSRSQRERSSRNRLVSIIGQERFAFCDDQLLYRSIASNKRCCDHQLEESTFREYLDLSWSSVVRNQLNTFGISVFVQFYNKQRLHQYVSICKSEYWNVFSLTIVFSIGQCTTRAIVHCAATGREWLMIKSSKTSWDGGEEGWEGGWDGAESGLKGGAWFHLCLSFCVFFCIASKLFVLKEYTKSK